MEALITLVYPDLVVGSLDAWSLCNSLRSDEKSLCWHCCGRISRRLMWPLFPIVGLLSLIAGYCFLLLALLLGIVSYCWPLSPIVGLLFLIVCLVFPIVGHCFSTVSHCFPLFAYCSPLLAIVSYCWATSLLAIVPQLA